MIDFMHTLGTDLEKSGELVSAGGLADTPQAKTWLEPLDTDDRMTHTHRLHAVRGHLLELAGNQATARTAYQLAARMTASLPEQRYLALRAARLSPPQPR